MMKRLVILAGVGLATVIAVPTIALGQEEQGSTGTEATSTTTTTESGTGGTGTEETTVTQSEEVTEESSGEDSESASTEIEPQTAPTTSSSTSTAASSTTVAVTSTQTSLTTATKSSGKKKKARASRKKCSTSSRAGGPVAQASAPLAPGCFIRFNPSDLEGAGVVYNPPTGGSIRIQAGSNQGQVVVTVLSGPVAVQLFVKGGPQSPGASCDLSSVATGASVSCFTPTNPNNGKPYGVSHVDVCPTTVQPPTTTEEQEGKKQDKKGEKKDEVDKQREVTAAAPAAVTPAGETLPFTGLPVAWLLIVGAALISGGLAIRRKP